VNEVHLIYLPANCCIGLSQRVFIGHRPYRLARCCCNMRSCGQARALIPRWFSLPDAAQGNAFFRLSLARVLKVVRFRLGCSTLPSVAQRNQGVCRAERVCPCCDQGTLDDEYHALCECPATRVAHAPFAHLFPLLLDPISAPGCEALRVTSQMAPISIHRTAQ